MKSPAELDAHLLVATADSKYMLARDWIKMDAKIKWLRQQFGNLVAVIHRDGGHRQGMIGHDEIETLVEDCVCLIGNERAKADEQAAEIVRLRKTISDAKIDSLCDQLQVDDPANLSLAVHATLREIVRLRSELAALKSAAEPVSVEERLPGEGWRLVRLENGDWTQRCMGHCGEWTNTDGGITHWLPLPPAPGAEKEKP